jgi:hypothetical protein
VSIPTYGGQVLEYVTATPRRASPFIYFINGIQTNGSEHAQEATEVATITERVVRGVFNRTDGENALGMGGDLLQCMADWIDVFLSQVGEMAMRGLEKVVNAGQKAVSTLSHLHVPQAFHFGHHACHSSPRPQPANRPAASAPSKSHSPIDLANAIRSRIPEKFLVEYVEWCLKWRNQATSSLFTQLHTNRQHPQLIVAHSQGNLITCDALWGMCLAYGEDSIAQMRVYSLASPAPAWPSGLANHRCVYGYKNDAVTLLDPHNWTPWTRSKGDWSTYGNGSVGLDGHHIFNNMCLLNFADDIRRYLGLPPKTYAVPTT